MTGTPLSTRGVRTARSVTLPGRCRPPMLAACLACVLALALGGGAAGAQSPLPTMTLAADAAGWQASGSYEGGPYVFSGVVRLSRDAPWPAGVLLEETPVMVLLDPVPVTQAFTTMGAWRSAVGTGTWHVELSGLWFWGTTPFGGVPLGFDGVTATFTVSAAADPRGPGFWRHHPEAWPVSTLSVASASLGTADLMDLLSQPVRGDATRILARQLVAARLNVTAGCDPVIQPVIDAAELLLQSFPIGSRPRGADKNMILHLKDLLEAWNEG